MGTTDDIFDRAAEANQSGDFFKFTNIGDKISGTYISLGENIDGYDNPQYIVGLKSSDGTLHRVAVRKSHTFLVDQLRNVRLGQIIGFKFEKEMASKNGGLKAKIINLAQVPGMVDDAWIADKIAESAKFGLTPEQALRPALWNNGVPTPTVPFTSPAPVATPAPANVVSAAVATPNPTAEGMAAAAPVVENPVFETIRSLVRTKGMAPANSTAWEVDEVIKSVTGLEMNEANTTQIIMKISTTV